MTSNLEGLIKERDSSAFLSRFPATNSYNKNGKDKNYKY